jgi:hypothetical protein
MGSISPEGSTRARLHKARILIRVLRRGTHAFDGPIQRLTAAQHWLSTARDRLDLPLITFVKEAQRRLSPRSVRVYLYALLPFLTFLEFVAAAPNDWPSWNISAERVRGYAGDNPLIDVGSRLALDVDARSEDGPPVMPDISGVMGPRLRKRLTDSFFKLVGEDWTPQIIDDPTFPVAILAGVRKLRGWGLREECATRMLFETGGRIFEVTGLTLADWRNRGLTKEATAASKGSHGKHVKFFRFSSETATLIRRYFDRERRSHDCRRWTLAEYLRAFENKLVDPHEVPLFLSTRGTRRLDRATVLGYLRTVQTFFQTLFVHLGITSMAEWDAGRAMRASLRCEVPEVHTLEQRLRFWSTYTSISNHEHSWLDDCPRTTGAAT